MLKTIGNKISNAFKRMKCWNRGNQNRSDESEERNPEREDELPNSKCSQTAARSQEMQNEFKLGDALNLFENERDRLSNEILNLEKHKHNFRLALASLESYVNQQREQLVELKRKNDQLKIALITTEIENHYQKNELATLREEVNWLKKTQLYEEKAKDDLKKKSDILKKEIAALKYALDSLNKKESRSIDKLNVSN